MVRYGANLIFLRQTDDEFDQIKRKEERRDKQNSHAAVVKARYDYEQHKTDNSQMTDHQKTHIRDSQLPQGD